MTFEVRAFRPEDIARFGFTAREVMARDYIGNPGVPALAGSGPASTGYWDGEIVACAGLIERHRYFAVAWLLVLPMPAGAVRAMIRAMRSGLDAAPYRRIEANVDIRFRAGARLAEALGFTAENTAKRFWFPDGGTAIEYVRLRPQ